MSKIKIKCIECGKMTKISNSNNVAICKKCLKENEEIYSPKRLNNDSW